MALPFFYLTAYEPNTNELTLDEDNSRHIVQVLRMQPGERLQLTDGKGTLLTAVIVDDHKKKCRVRVESSQKQPPPKKKVIVAISLLKNTTRFEWFLEKATEIGVGQIVPLLCERTEKQHARPDRLRNILVSAMLQSQQAWLPELPDPTPLTTLLSHPPCDEHYIAHCLEAPRPTTSLATLEHTPSSRLILIGPEGDFSPDEIKSALNKGFVPVTLGDNRLRTETAGVVAATLLCIG
ncbi:MAG: 16S rRNA (uracil(1498)-N(3))-methyltransferase [Bacteroidetes bacterium]|nr:16S rRNA (uracil(1498)-N(3))-methyltransferase [Bacteroidota bacterium]